MFIYHLSKERSLILRYLCLLFSFLFFNPIPSLESYAQFLPPSLDRKSGTPRTSRGLGSAFEKRHQKISSPQKNSYLVKRNGNFLVPLLTEKGQNPLSPRQRWQGDGFAWAHGFRNVRPMVGGKVPMKWLVVGAIQKWLNWISSSKRGEIQMTICKNKIWSYKLYRIIDTVIGKWLK